MSRLIVRAPTGPSAVEVPAGPDLPGARRWLAVVHQVSRIQIRLVDGVVECVATGRSHRMPFSRSIPVALGLGLAQLGVPTWVERDDG